jgi:hypothetical protein
MRCTRFALGMSLVVALTAGCAETSQYADASQPALASVTVTKAEPVGCQERGVMQVCGGWGGYESAVEGFKERAPKRGANYVVLDAVAPAPFCANSYGGRLFYCASPPRQEAMRTAPSQAGADNTCDPPCSPGFRCQRTVCTPLCNPSCGPGEECGSDRLCHQQAQTVPPEAPR